MILSTDDPPHADQIVQYTCAVVLAGASSTQKAAGQQRAAASHQSSGSYTVEFTLD